MKNKYHSFFRFSTFAIIAAIIFCLALFASAESSTGNESPTHPTGLEWDDPEVISSHQVNTEPSTWGANRDPAYDEPYYVLGDMDDDLIITAADARAILRAAVDLEPLPLI